MLNCVKLSSPQNIRRFLFGLAEAAFSEVQECKDTTAVASCLRPLPSSVKWENTDGERMRLWLISDTNPSCPTFIHA
jgi:hypothetical protein